MDIKDYGDQVKINSVGSITVSNYAPNVTTITPQQLTAQQTILEIDQAKYFSFYLDDVDQAQTKPKLMGEAMRKSAHALADVADRHVSSFYSFAGGSVCSSGILANGSNVLAVLANAALELDQNNVPAQGRWLIIPPWFHQRLITAEVMQTQGSIDANATYRNGYVGQSYGFDIFTSNNLTTGISIVGARSHYAMAGVGRAMSFAEQIVKLDAYRPENSFSDAVKGLHVYGAKVIDPSALVRVNISDTGM